MKRISRDDFIYNPRNVNLNDTQESLILVPKYDKLPDCHCDRIPGLERENRELSEYKILAEKDIKALWQTIHDYQRDIEEIRQTLKGGEDEG